MERKLATIRQVKTVEPIPGADFIEIAKIDGWQCVVKKDEFQAGDLCVYFEIDSFLPIEPQYEFLRKSSYKKMGEEEGFRLKTIKLKGQLSQGLALPLSSFSFHITTPLVVGIDLTEILNIKKYERPVPIQMEGKVKRYFPSFIKKTDQERIQNISEEIITGGWIPTEKLDGTSFTCYKYNGEFGVCSRNLELCETEENLYWQIARKYNLEEILPDDVCIQGEIVGPGIQDNIYKLSEPTLFLFHIFYINLQTYSNLDTLKLFCHNNNINCVPVFDPIDLTGKSTDEILLLAEGKSAIGDTEREGLVFYKYPFSFKAISNRFLLKQN